LNGLNPSEVDSVAANARNALSQVANLLDTKNGNTYVFGGEDSGNPPVPAPDQIQSSAFFTTIQTDVSGLSISTPGDTQAAALANSPISATPSKPPVVQIGEGTTVQIGLLANANSVAKSSGPTTTQSYMLDLMRALATLGSMSSSQVSNPNFAGLVQDTSATLKDVVGAMATDAGVLGTTQANLTDTQTQLTATSTALSGQVAAVQEVDMATTLSHLTGMQTQLQASYRLISAATSMSLVNFLPAGA
jgi:flagellar hook-associated protein 3 FlgL